LTKPEPRLLAVDLDGTLVDSAPDIAHCLGEALVAVGFDAPGEALTRSWIGDGVDTLVERALAHATSSGHAATAGRAAAGDLHRKTLAEFLDRYAERLFVESRLYPEAADTLDAFRAAGVRLCCITNKRHAFSESILEQAHVRDRFELVIGGDSLPEKKPSPLPLVVAADKLGIGPSGAMMVGDSTQDLAAACGAGFGFAFASYGYGRVDERDLGTALRLLRFSDLKTLLDG
jgi:phosphoglycolate phosphatase